MNILKIIESNDWQISLSEEVSSKDGEKSIVIEGDAHSFRILANILIEMSRTVEAMPAGNKQGYGIMFAPEEISQLMLPDADNLILECTTKQNKRKKKK